MGAAASDLRTSSVVVLGGYAWPAHHGGDDRGDGDDDGDGGVGGFPGAVATAVRYSYGGVTGERRGWELMPPMLQARCCAAAAADSAGFIYVAGGGESMFATAECFDTVERYVHGSSAGAAGVWEQMPPMNQRRCGFGMAYSR